ncbi:hypothetical protein TYRP_018149 [Tyrophagus putrescentiae]|nr:hypothetical protein TYRP_018149 [Tyrophagus putrescentiae]
MSGDVDCGTLVPWPCFKIINSSGRDGIRTSPVSWIVIVIIVVLVLFPEVPSATSSSSDKFLPFSLVHFLPSADHHHHHHHCRHHHHHRWLPTRSSRGWQHRRGSSSSGLRGWLEWMADNKLSRGWHYHRSTIIIIINIIITSSISGLRGWPRRWTTAQVEDGATPKHHHHHQQSLAWMA